MRVLLIGASGFAGRHFFRAATEASLDVVPATRRGEDDAVRIDLLDPASIERALEATRPDAVVNLAGAASVSESFGKPHETFSVNALGPLALLDAVSKISPDALVLLVSSGEVYGDADSVNLPLDEEAPLIPQSPYAGAKVAMEVVAGQYVRTAGLRVAIARSFNHTGPGQSDAFAASSFARQLAEAEHAGDAEAVLEVGNLAPVRDFSDVRDVVRAYVELLEGAHTGVFNVCSGVPTPVGRIVELLVDASAIPVRVEVSEARLRQGEPQALYGSASLIQKTTGWRPTYALDRTLNDLLDSWRQGVI